MLISKEFLTKFNNAFEDALESILNTYASHKDELNLYVHEDFLDPQMNEIAEKYLSNTLENVEVRLVSIVVYNETREITKSNRDEIRKQIEEIINKLKSINMIDDNYLSSSILNYCMAQLKGPKSYKNKLYERKINIIHEYSEEAQIEVLRKSIEKNKDKNSKLPAMKQKSLLTQKLLRDGFDEKYIYKIIGEIEFDDETEEQLERLQREFDKLEIRYSKYSEYEKIGMKGIWISYIEFQSVDFSSRENFADDICKGFLRQAQKEGMNITPRFSAGYGDLDLSLQKDFINILDAAKKTGKEILPVDSEHSAIFQCLMGSHSKDEISRLILTCSGGPFWGMSKGQLCTVTKSDALKHPNWKMGAKITIDCATLMNKGLEVIEAMRLYRMPIDKVSVLVHRQSIVHSMVEFVDGAVMAQMGTPDMRLPIQLALTYPQRMECPVDALDLLTCGSLTFAAPDMEAFPCLALARQCAKQGGTSCAIMNGANEAAVALFLDGRIRFQDIGLAVDNPVGIKAI